MSMINQLKVIAFILLPVLLLSCTTMTDVNDTIAGDWDWALEIATQAIEDSYGTDFYTCSFYGENLNREGFLDEGMLFPVWTIYLANGENYYLRLRIHPDGDYFLEKRERQYGWEDPLNFRYTSVDVRRWLAIASYAYRQLSGRLDDVSYELSCETWGGYEDTVSIGLYDLEYERIGYVDMNARSGEVGSVSAYR